MSATLLKLASFTGALVVAFGTAYAVGAGVDPITTSTSDTARSAARSADIAPLGLAASQDGYTLAPAASTIPASARAVFRFTVTGPEGRPVTSYRGAGTSELRLIVVRRDLQSLQQPHPVRDADGAWSVQLDLSASGLYRVLADFQPIARDRALTLGADITVPGTFRPVLLPLPESVVTVEGYDVSIAGVPVAGRESELTFTVTKGGEPVIDLQPDLGAFGQLVCLRISDLAYLRTRPVDVAPDGGRGGPALRFATEFPAQGTYRLFLDFRVGGQVRTAEFTVAVRTGSATPTAQTEDQSHDE